MHDDERIGHLLRLLRKHSETTQERLATIAGVPRVDVIDIEAGRCANIPIGRVRSMFDAVRRPREADGLLERRGSRV